MANRSIRLLIVTAISGATILVGVGSAQAFEPPEDPAEVFNCVVDEETGSPPPVNGFPGNKGVTKNVSPDNPGPWNAAENSDQITFCG
jgi:hypothetical protein